VFEAHWNLFAAYAAMNDIAEAQRELETLKTITPFSLQTYTRVAALYATLKRYDESIAVVHEALREFPDSADLYFGLAEIYAAQGQNKEAREAVEKAGALSPQSKPQIDAFLKDLEAGKLLRPS
jgi:tetratricopeptide (TPR) repeat protein